jgi:hypothetical protein
MNWNSLKKGAIVRITDILAFEQSMKAGDGVVSQDYEFVGCLNVQATTDTFKDNLPIQWQFVTLRDAKTDIVTLIQKTVYVEETGEDIVDIGLFYEPIEGGDRSSYIDRDIRWLFNPPENEDNWSPGKLSLAKYPAAPDIMENDKEVRVEFEMNKIGIVFGTYREESEKYPAMVTEFQDSVGISVNPRLLLLEQAFLDRDGEVKENGGWLRLFLGCSIEESDVDVLG